MFHIPKVTKPALADSVSLGAPSSSWGAVGDQEQEGALLSEAARLASTNCYIIIGEMNFSFSNHIKIKNLMLQHFQFCVTFKKEVARIVSTESLNLIGKATVTLSACDAQSTNHKNLIYYNGYNLKVYNYIYIPEARGKMSR